MKLKNTNSPFVPINNLNIGICAGGLKPELQNFGVFPPALTGEGDQRRPLISLPASETESANSAQ